MNIKKVQKKIAYTIYAIMTILAANTWAQENGSFSLSGTITDSISGKSIEFATVAIVEIKQKINANENGEYTIDLPTGEYTMIFNSPGMKSVTKKVRITGAIVLDIALEPTTIGGSAITIQGERDVQKVSRYTMPKEEIKEVPGTFGDSLRAVETMAGIERGQTMGPFGWLAIRGLGPDDHRFYVDGIPVRKVQHFGALHSIFNNEVLRDIDVFSSAFPVMRGSATGSVLEFNSIDEVKEFQMVADISLLSANATVLSPVQIEEQPGVNEKEKSAKTKTIGYWIAGARYGYLSLFAPKLAKAMTGDKGIDFDISYYDYQLKGKYFLSTNHALTLFLFGGAEGLDFDINFEVKTKEELIDDGADPFALDVAAVQESYFHTQSLMHTYLPSSKIKNDFKVYTSLNESKLRYNNKTEGVASWAANHGVITQPNMYGAKNDFRLSVFEEFYILNTGLELTYYDFLAQGITMVPKHSINGSGYIDLTNPTDESKYEVVNTNQKSNSLGAGGYMQNRLQYEGFELAGGFRVDHLNEQNLTTIDPRGRFTYTSPFDTSISLAGGQYSSFVQTNVYYFEFFPQLFETKLKAERGFHRSFGIEQKFKEKYSVKLEGYLNNFDRMLEFVGDANTLADNLGERRIHGIEVSLKKESTSGKFDCYGWINYTYGKSESKSNMPNDPLGNEWISGDFDRTHSLKLVGGIRYGLNLLGLRFQYYSSYPETPIIGDDGGIAYTLDDVTSRTRYAPTYGESNSRFRSPQHQLDVRFSRTSQYEWGHIKWYIEFLNIYNFKPEDSQNWAYNKPYADGKNPTYGSTAALALIPNFGVEFKF
ncbi:MAG: TonB-dependent receptor [Spirochaetia bacterium]|nr:TonB-dependent receptor [Spirochaetia bacterium]